MTLVNFQDPLVTSLVDCINKSSNCSFKIKKTLFDPLRNLSDFNLLLNICQLNNIIVEIITTKSDFCKKVTVKQKTEEDYYECYTYISSDLPRALVNALLGLHGISL